MTALRRSDGRADGRRIRRILLLSLFVAAITCVVFLVWGAVEADRGRDALLIAADELSPTELASGGAETTLRSAARSLDRSHRLLTNPVTVPARLLPVIGRQIRSANALVVSAGRVASAAADAAVVAERLSDDPPSDGGGRLTALRELADAVDAVGLAVRAADLGPRQGLLPIVADGRNTMARKLDEADRQVETMSGALRAVSDMLDGPSRYLLVAANNAEMRAGAGMFLVAGPLLLSGGELDLGDMTATGDLELETSVPVDPVTERLWGWTEPGREWRNLQMWPAFDRSAALAAAMWEAGGGAPVDGVLLVDVLALRAMLRATGPVTVPGATIGESDIEERLFVEQYRDLDAETLADDNRLEATQNARREQLGAIAQAAVAKIRDGDVDLLTLVEEFGGAAGGRHVLLWSKNDAHQDAWEAASVAGVMTERSMLLSVLNRAANKLDAHLEVASTVTRNGDTVTVRVDLENPAGLGLPPYVAGPDPSVDVPPGTYVGLVSLTVPGTATAVEVDGEVVVAGSEGPTKVLATSVTLLEGGQTIVEFTFDLPPAFRVRLEPSARAPATPWNILGEELVDDQAHEIEI